MWKPPVKINQRDKAFQRSLGPPAITQGGLLAMTVFTAKTSGAGPCHAKELPRGLPCSLRGIFRNPSWSLHHTRPAPVKPAIVVTNHPAFSKHLLKQLQTAFPSCRLLRIGIPSSTVNSLFVEYLYRKLIDFHSYVSLLENNALNPMVSHIHQMTIFVWATCFVQN